MKRQWSNKDSTEQVVDVKQLQADSFQRQVCFGMVPIDCALDIGLVLRKAQFVNVPYKLCNTFDPVVEVLPTRLELSSDCTKISHPEDTITVGRLDPFAINILSVLQKDVAISIQLYLDAAPVANVDAITSRKGSKGVPLQSHQPALYVILYGSRALFEAIGLFASKCGYFLQEPRNCDRNIEYCNPHCLTPASSHILFTNELGNALHQDISKVSRYSQDLNPIDMFTDNTDHALLPETESPRCFKTTLKRYAIAASL